MSEGAITLDDERKCACSPIQYAQTSSSSVYQCNLLPQYTLKQRRKRKHDQLTDESEETQVNVKGDKDSDEPTEQSQNKT